MLLSPRRVLAEYKKQLIARGIRNPHTRTGLAARPEIAYRKIPVSTVLKKTGISEYAKDTPFAGTVAAQRVRVPLRRHGGAAAEPVVTKGDWVKTGDVVAAAPADKLGAVCHASIDGRIVDLNPDWLEIRKG